jgi:hypothetical protein
VTLLKSVMTDPTFKTLLITLGWLVECFSSNQLNTFLWLQGIAMTKNARKTHPTHCEEVLPFDCTPPFNSVASTEEIYTYPNTPALLGPVQEPQEKQGKLTKLRNKLRFGKKI